jgi:hypothetical protein
MNSADLTVFLLLLALMALVALVVCDDDNDPRFP